MGLCCVRTVLDAFSYTSEVPSWARSTTTADLSSLRLRSLVLFHNRGRVGMVCRVNHGMERVLHWHKRGRHSCGQHFPENGKILLPEFQSGYIRVEPSTNEAVGLLVGQGSVLFGIFFD